MENVATHAGSRRSERRNHLRAQNQMPVQGQGFIDPYDPRQFVNYPEIAPGKHCVVVPQNDAMTNAPSPVGTYKSEGYEVVAREGNWHTDSVLMGISAETFAQRQREQADGPDGHNTKLAQPTRYDQRTGHLYFDQNPGTAGSITMREPEPITLEEAAKKLPPGPLTK